MSYLLGKVPVSELERMIGQNDGIDKNSPLTEYLYVHIGPVVKEKTERLFLCIVKDPEQMDSAIMVPYSGEPFWKYNGELSESTQKYQQALIRYRNHWMKVPIESIIKYLKSGSTSDIEVRITFPEGIAIILQQPGGNLLVKCVRITKIRDFERALHAHGKALDLDPKDAESWILIGDELYQQKKYGEANECWDKALETNPDCSELWERKGSALLCLERYDEAIAVYEKTLRINPNIPRLWERKGSALQRLKKFIEAIEAYDRALQINPNIPDLWERKGSALQCLEKYDEAIEAYDRALQINPKRVWYWQRKISVLYRLERYNDAIAVYDSALEINPKNAWCWQKKGDTLRHLKRYDEAIEAYDKALEINPKSAIRSAWYWQRKGDVLLRLEKYNEAIEAYDIALDMCRCTSDIVKILRSKGSAFRHLGRIEDAEECSRRADNVPGC